MVGKEVHTIHRTFAYKCILLFVLWFNNNCPRCSRRKLVKGWRTGSGFECVDDKNCTQRSLTGCLKSQTRSHSSNYTTESTLTAGTGVDRGLNPGLRATFGVLHIIHLTHS